MASNATAQIDLKLDDKHVRPALDKAEKNIQGFSNRAKSLFAAVAIGLSVTKFVSWGKELLAIAGIQEKAEAKLASVLKATGGAAGFTAEQLTKIAAGYQEITTFGDEAIINGQAVLATFRNIRGDVFTDATKAMLNMAEVMDTDLKGGAVQLGKALNDPTQGISALTRVGVTFTDQQKEQIKTLHESGDIMRAQRIILAELESEFGGAAEGAAKTFTGQMKQLSNSTGDLWEIMGSLVSEVLKPLMPLLVRGVAVTQEWAESMRPLAQEIGASIIGLLEWSGVLTTTTDDMVRWFVTAKVLFSRIDEVIASTLLHSAATVVGWANDLSYYFTDVIPHGAKVLWSVMKDVFSQLDDLILTVAGNMSRNIDDFVSSIKSALTGGDWNFEPTNLLEGFELKLNDLPELADKKSSELEKILREAGKDIDTSIGEEIAAGIEKAKKSAKDGIELDLTPKVMPFDAEAMAAKKKEDDKKENDKKDKKDKKEKPPEQKTDGRLSFGLLAFFDKIQGAAREKTEFKPIIDSTNETTEAVKTTTKAIEKSAAVAKSGWEKWVEFQKLSNKEQERRRHGSQFSPEDTPLLSELTTREERMKAFAEREESRRLDKMFPPLLYKPQRTANSPKIQTFGREQFPPLLFKPEKPTVKVETNQDKVVTAVDRVVTAVERIDSRARAN